MCVTETSFATMGAKNSSEPHLKKNFVNYVRFGMKLMMRDTLGRRPKESSTGERVDGKERKEKMSIDVRREERKSYSWRIEPRFYFSSDSLTT